VGTVELKVERLAIISAERQLLIVHHADPGSPSERGLAHLAGLAAANIGSASRTPPH
jgi:hypothetical protein